MASQPVCENELEHHAAAKIKDRIGIVQVDQVLRYILAIVGVARRRVQEVRLHREGSYSCIDMELSEKRFQVANGGRRVLTLLFEYSSTFEVLLSTDELQYTRG